MKESVIIRSHAAGATGGHFDTNTMQRSKKPPAFSLSAGKADHSIGATPVSGQFLSGSIGRGAKNDPVDLERMANFLNSQGIPESLAKYANNPTILGDVLERYQREALGWKNVDGRADPGGKTITAILAGEGREVVAGWIHDAFSSSQSSDAIPEKTQGTIKQREEKAGTVAKLAEGEQWTMPPLLGEADYITQAPPNRAAGAKTLTKNQLFSYDLSSYGPGQTRDISNSKLWTSHTNWNHRKYGHWSDYGGALAATHWLGCHNACIYMAQNGGVSGVSHNSDYNQKMKVSKAKGEAAQSCIDPQLKAGKVVVVRVDGHHSILIIGKGRDAKGEFYAFFDPGRTGTKGYNLKANRLYITKKSISNSRYGRVSGVRQSNTSS